MRFMGNSPSAAPRRQARGFIGFSGRASFYDKGTALSPFWLGLLRRHRAGRPEVGPADTGQALGLGTPPGRDLGMVARGQHLRDRPTLPELRPGIMRIFEQPL